VKWKYETLGSVLSSPAIADGKVYIGSWEFWCLNATGNGDGTTELIWSFGAGDIRFTYCSPSVTDGKVFVGSHYPQMIFCFRENNPPETPETPDGPSEGSVGEELTFSTKTRDPEGDKVSFLFYWGEGQGTSGWVGPFDSEEEAYVSHIWNESGNFNIKVRAQDAPGALSSWSETFTVHIHASRVKIGGISGGLGSISTEIINDGEGTAFDVNWNVSVTGGILGLINVTYNGTISELPGATVETVSTTDFIFGLGRIEMIVSASGPHFKTVTEQVNGFVFGPFVLVRG
jgi:hypothetical protein